MQTALVVATLAAPSSVEQDDTAAAAAAGCSDSSSSSSSSSSRRLSPRFGCGVASTRVITGGAGAGECVSQPLWGIPEGGNRIAPPRSSSSSSSSAASAGAGAGASAVLYFISDRSGWWNIYSVDLSAAPASASAGAGAAAAAPEATPIFSLA